MTSFGQRALTVAALVAVSLPAAAEFKIVRRTTFPRRDAPVVQRIAPIVETIWVQGPRRRSQAGVGWIYLAHCDKGQIIQINPETRLFRIEELGPDGMVKRGGSPPANRSTPQKVLYEYTVTTENTGQKATVFGYPAWLVRDTVTSRSSRRGAGSTTVIETWYIDLHIATGCQQLSEPLAEFAGSPNVKVTRVGEAKRGFPVLSRRVYGEGEKRHEVVVEVTEISRMELDPRFFEVPPDHQPGLDGPLEVPNTTANRAKASWESFWLRLAKIIY